MQRILSWVQANIDDLYEAERSRRIERNPDQYSNLSQAQEFKEKAQYKAFLLEQAEEMCRTHQMISVHGKRMQEFKNSTHNASFAFKQKYVDEFIEADISYFNKKAVDEDNLGMVQIKAKMRKAQKLQ